MDLQTSPAQEATDAFYISEERHEPIIVVGNGPVGIRAANLILEQGSGCEVMIFGEEKTKPYNRVQLSMYLAGKVEKSELDNPLAFRDPERVTEHYGARIESIDTVARRVTVDSGEVYGYSKLILATGARPRIPEVANLELDGVHQFRTIDDTQQLLSLKQESKNIFIMGSGPLGLETAFAMKQPNNQVTLQVRRHLLSSDFTPTAQKVLSDYIEASGIEIVSGRSVKTFVGDKKVEAVKLDNGERIACDSVIMCAGIEPNSVLAKSAGLETRRGVVVDAYMRTSNPHIYAIGECAEFNRQTIGLVAPGFEQAATCVEHILGKPKAFESTQQAMKVKFGGYSTASYGQLEGEGLVYFSFTNRLKGIYRKLVVKDNLLVGAVVVGNWDEESELKIAIAENKKFRPKQFKAFTESGLLIAKPDQHLVQKLPDDYLVCLCKSVSRGELSNAIKEGCRTLESLGEKTGAGTVCGSCKPLLCNLLDTPAPNLVMRHQKAILWTSIISIALILLTIFFEPLAITNTVQLEWHLEKLWFDNFWKQVSGYSLLGLCLIAGALGVRKRWKRFNFGHVDSWRYAHSIIGVLALIVLMVHTGVRMGANLNFALMAVFLAATLTGSLVGVFMAKNHHWSDLKLRKHRLWWSRIHHTLLWMLPPLLCFHILSVYYF